MIAVSALLLFQAALTAAQTQINHTKGNECRHVCIVSRGPRSSFRSTNCFMPLKPASRRAIRLRNTLDKEASWTLDHRGSMNGQVFYVDRNAVYFLSQKVCLDAGNATGLPIRPMFRKLSNNATPTGMIGDFNYRPSQGDIYKGCVENDAPWSDFVFKNSIEEKGERLPETLTQYMKSHAGRHAGRHERQGFHLIPYEFNYTAHDLEQTFQFALDQASSRKHALLPSEKPQVRSGNPVIVYGYPFETGHTVVGTEKNITGAPRNDLNEDTITVLGWNRLQEAVASLSGRPTPPVLLPEAITENDLLAITVMALLSIIAFRHTLRTTADARRDHVLKWPLQGKKEGWTLVKTAADHEGFESYPPPIKSHDFSGVWITFVGAAVAIVGAIFTFRSSNLRFSRFMVVRQGGVITYGPSEPARWGLDQQNMRAGSIFVVGHWYVAQIVQVGYVAIFEVILGIYCACALWLLLHFYRFATFREHQLDKSRFRLPIRFFRAAPQAIVGVIALCPGASYVLSIHSYRTLYVQIAKDFMKTYLKTEFSPVVQFSEPWDGELIPPARLDKRVVPGQLTEDNVEKAAAFLAADKFGKLRYPQVLALLSSERLIKAAHDFHNYGTMLTSEEVRGFSQLFYIKGILLPECSEKNGAIHVCFSDLDDDDDDQKLRKSHKNVVLRFLPPGGDEGPFGTQKLAIIK